jgi:hypothetical protein
VKDLDPHVVLICLATPVVAFIVIVVTYIVLRIRGHR